MRLAVAQPAQARSTVKTFPAPVRGWVENENLAINKGVGATVLENCVPLTDTVRARGGHILAATIPAAVKTIIPYHRAGADELYAVTDAAIYDISGFGTGTQVKTVTEGKFSYIQFAVTGDPALVMVNGEDPMVYYDGATWGEITGISTPAITGVDTSDLCHIWQYKSAIWAVEKDTMVAWYLPVDSYGGTASDFSLGGIFKNGGKLLFGATWSQDTGDGMDDRVVFVSSEGEVAVFGGSNPDLDDWHHVGTYEMAPPLTPQTVKAGGDLLLVTADGIVSLSAVMTKDPQALAAAAITYPIEPAWKRVTKAKPLANDVQVVKGAGLLVVGYPWRSDETHVANITTGAWSRWTRSDIQALGIYGGFIYYGDITGKIYRMDAGGSDDGTPFVARGTLLPDHLNAPGAFKVPKMVRATWKHLRGFRSKLTIASNYKQAFTPAPPAFLETTVPSLWDVAFWDEGKWDDSDDAEARITELTLWKSIVGTGAMQALQFQITCGGNRKPDVELVTFDLLYEVGGTVV